MCVDVQYLHSDRRTSTDTDTMNDRLQIYWNGVSTAQYDPRPAVETFLTKREGCTCLRSQYIGMGTLFKNSLIDYR